MCLLYKKHFDVDVSICRFYNVYGPHQLTEGEYYAVVGIFENQYKNKEELTITKTENREETLPTLTT